MQRLPDDEVIWDDYRWYLTEGVPYTGIVFEDHPVAGYGEETIVDGYQEGPWRQWRLDGSPESDGSACQNNPHGYERAFDTDGVLMRKTRWQCGYPTHIWERQGEDMVLTYQLVEDPVQLARFHQFAALFFPPPPNFEDPGDAPFPRRDVHAE